MYNFNLPPPNLERPNMIGNALTAYGGVQQIQGQGMKNALMEEEITQRKDLKNALTEYGKTGSTNMQGLIQKVMPIKPELAIQLQTIMRTGRKDQIDMLVSGAKLTEAMAPALMNNPNAYIPFFKQMTDLGINSLPSPDTMIGPDGQIDPAKVNDLARNLVGLKDIIKEAAKTKTPHFLPPAYDAQGNIIQNVVQPGSNQVTQLPGVQGGKDYGTETLVPLEGKGPAMVVNKRPGTAYPEGYGPMGQVRIDMGHTSPEKRRAVLKGIDDGTIPPSMLSKRAADYNEMLGEAQDMGINLVQRQLQFEGAKRFVGTLNNQQNSRLRQVGGTVIKTVDRVEELAKEMDLSGFRPLNWAQLNEAVKVEGNSPRGVLAQQYITQINFLKSKFAQMESGGYAPITEAWRLANEQINQNFGLKQLQGVLKEIKRDTGYSLASLTEQGALMPPDLQENNPQQQQSGKPNIPQPKLQEFYKLNKSKIDNLPPGPDKDMKMKQLNDAAIAAGMQL